MGQKLPENELKLYKQIDEILWKDWDPIGVYNEQGVARDEYYSYVPAFFAFAKKKGSLEEFLQIIQEAEDHMGLSSSAEKKKSLYEKIMNL